MPEYRHPGVYIEEIERGPKPIEGVLTSTAAFLGETERGPTKPRLVTSYEDYMRWFGGVFGMDKFMPYAVKGFFENGGTRLYICRITDDAATPAETTAGNLTVRAAGPGSWGGRVYVKIEDGSTKKPGPDNTMVPVGFRLRLAYYAAVPTQNPLDWFDDPGKPPFPSHVESFDDLVADEESPDFYEKRLLDASALARLVRGPSAAPGERPACAFFALGSNAADGAAALDVADFEGRVQPPQRPEPQGLAALELDLYREAALVYAPGAPVGVAKAIISHCERQRFRFAVIDSERQINTNFEPRNTIADTKYAAYYYPWLAVPDPQTGARRIVPPGGHPLGIYARTDSERGVFTAPANETVRGVLELDVETDDRTQDVFDPRGINAIRQFPGRGIRVWGARTLASDPLWKYVSVTRFLMFIERSLYEGTQWVVFEPNDDRLWARVVDTVRRFLRGQWRSGALPGRTENEAFFIICDRTTMTEHDILNGRLICEIGIAPVRPAEFVVFRIFQPTAEAQP